MPDEPTTSAKTVVITGSSDGIGAAAARQLHQDGHQVVIVGRSPGKTLAVAHSIGADHFVADFTRLDEVRKLAAELDAAYPRIDVLANNAGGVFGDRTKTADGFERTFQVNYLAAFLLTGLLIDKLTASAAAVIQTSSVGARMAGRLDIDDLDHDRNFSPVRAYNAAKLEDILFTRELHRRYHAQGISAAAFHPGNVATSFATESDSRLMKFIATNPVTRAMLSTPERGADQLVWLAESTPGADWESGTYYQKRRPARRINPQALDANLARNLWDRSEQLTGPLTPGRDFWLCQKAVIRRRSQSLLADCDPRGALGRASARVCPRTTLPMPAEKKRQSLKEQQSAKRLAGVRAPATASCSSSSLSPS